MKILITGPQGSGKTTQSKILAQRLGLCDVKTGDLVREVAKENSPEGEKVRAALDSGDLVDDQLVVKLVKEALAHPRCNNGFVMDGYPRSISQLHIFDPGYDKVIYLEISDEEVIKRMLKRDRKDDVPELIAQRLRIFHQETGQVLEHFRQLGKLVTISGDQSIEKVTEAIIRALYGQK